VSQFRGSVDYVYILTEYILQYIPSINSEIRCCLLRLNWIGSLIIIIFQTPQDCQFFLLCSAPDKSTTDQLQQTVSALACCHVWRDVISVISHHPHLLDTLESWATVEKSTSFSLEDRKMVRNRRYLISKPSNRFLFLFFLTRIELLMNVWSRNAWGCSESTYSTRRIWRFYISNVLAALETVVAKNLAMFETFVSCFSNVLICSQQKWKFQNLLPYTRNLFHQTCSKTLSATEWRLNVHPLCEITFSC